MSLPVLHGALSLSLPLSLFASLSLALSLSLQGLGVATASRSLPPCASAHPQFAGRLFVSPLEFSPEGLGCKERARWLVSLSCLPRPRREPLPLSGIGVRSKKSHPGLAPHLGIRI